MTFDSLGLAPDLLRAVADQGYTEPTPVQREAIPLVLAGRDVLAAAQTGTGKTAAFVLPILQMLHATRQGSPAHAPSQPRDSRLAPQGPVRTLVLTPTRELALQVEESVRTYGAHRPVRSTIIYGGVAFPPQVRALRTGPEIVVATPGRLLDHLGQGTLDLSRVEILVLDEADRMLDMGFIRDIRRILALLPARRQNLLFSATFSPEIRALAADFLYDPAQVQVSPRNTAPELVKQLVITVDRERKRELLSHLVKTRRIDQALVFTRTKHGANRLALQLDKDGIEAVAIHGNKSQPQRVRALGDFKAGRVTVLVATDIASRGLDIESLPHVVNFELPMVPEDYVHRIGRTGRAGVDGEAISLVCVDEARLLRDIETLLRHPIPATVVPGFEPDRSIRPEPILQRSGARSRMLPGRPEARPMYRAEPRLVDGALAARSAILGPRPSGGRPAPATAPSRPRPTGGNAPWQQSRPAGSGPRPAGAVPRQRQRPSGSSIGQGGPSPAFRASNTSDGDRDRRGAGPGRHGPAGWQDTGARRGVGDARTGAGSGPSQPARPWHASGSGRPTGGDRPGAASAQWPPTALPGERFARSDARPGDRT